LRAAVAAQPDYPSVLFVYSASVEDGQAFFANAWPEARAIADPDRVLYEGFGVKQAKWSQMMSPGVIACGLRAASKGHVQGRTVGDSWQLPGAFLVQGERILWKHDYAHAGDAPDWGQLPEIARQYADSRRHELNPSWA
jgi:hypothetical protein